MSERSRIQPGAKIEPHELVTIRSTRIQIPDRERIVHLQFRRFAGCPVCNLHLHSIVQRHHEILAASIREIVVFHSSVEELLPYADGLPFPVVADPEKRLYHDFGVESGMRSLLDPHAWQPILRALFRSLSAIRLKQEPVPVLNPRGGRLGLPADFLIAPDGRVVACKYGAYVYDQWSVNQILELSKAESPVGRRFALAVGQPSTRDGGDRV